MGENLEEGSRIWMQDISEALPHVSGIPGGVWV